MDWRYNLRLFKEIFFPRHCAVCKTIIDEGLLCSSCRKNYLLHRVKVYGANHSSWEKLIKIGQPLVAEDIYDRTQFLYKYDGVYKESLHGLKFEGKSELLPMITEEVELALQEDIKALQRHYDIIASIPTSVERKQQRGYDVPLEIFNCLNIQELLERVKTTAPLYTMDALERQQGLEGCFAIKVGQNVQGKRILLCDDIYTTGSTMHEAAQVLLKAGAQAIGVLAFCASKDNWN